MLDLNVTLLFQLANFFIAIFVLNILLIRPTRARQDAGSNREEGRAAGAAEQQKLVGEAQQSARNILAETRASLQAQAAETLDTLRKQVGEFSSRLADRLIKG